jgi:hypothetical protein
MRSEQLIEGREAAAVGGLLSGLSSYRRLT